MNLATYPKIRLAINLSLSSAVGVFASIFAAQIMPNGVLTWSVALYTSGLWLLLGATGLLVLVQVAYLNADMGLLKYADDLHCEAVIRRAKLEAIVADLKNNPDKVYALDVKAIRQELGLKRTTKRSAQ